MENLDVFVALSIMVAGSAIFMWRLVPMHKRHSDHSPSGDIPRVSVIVPARNEAHNLPRLLRSLQVLDPAPLEVIVVDDNSEDETSAVARSFGVRMIHPGPKPPEWIGKSWACRAGASAATGDILLFTDADTEHGTDSLARAVTHLQGEKVGLLSLVPTHIVEAFWERFQGIYQLLLLIATRAGAQDSGSGKERRFAIGQYLMFTREAYESIGGHECVHDRLSEDLALAQIVSERGLGVRVLVAPGAMRVRMYPDGVRSFFAGWRRSFRDGIQSAGIVAVAELVLVIGWLLGVFQGVVDSLLRGDPLMLSAWGLAYVATSLLVALEQRHYGPFPWYSALAYPWFALIFVGVTSMTLYDSLCGAPVKWRGRVFQLTDR